VRVPAGRQRLAIDYAGLNLSAPDRVRFRYKLDGVDHQWNGPVAANEAVYPQLAPGFYRFHVAASNADGLWNSSEATIAFDVDPAFWQTWWFQASGVISLALSAVILYRLRLRQLTRQLNLRFEERLMERNRIARELHDTLLQNMTGLSLHISGIAKVVTAPAVAKERLIELKRLAEDCLRETRQSVWDLRMESEMIDLSASLHESGRQLTAGRAIDFVFNVEGERADINANVRRQLLRIGREAIGNAVKHARAGEIQVLLNFEVESVRLEVSDNGQGFDPCAAAGIEGHFGLATMRERANGMNAVLKVSSTLGQGTRVEVTVPAPFEK
jgi:signal transduction histidine kinase